MDVLATGRRRLELCVDVLLIVASFYVTYFLNVGLRAEVASYHWQGSRFLTAEVLTVVSWSLAVLLFGEYPTRRQSHSWQDAWIVLRVNALGLLIFTSCLFLFKFGDLSRMFSALYFLVNIIVMASFRTVVRLWLSLRRRAGADLRRHLIVGFDGPGRRYFDSILRNPGLGIQVVGYVDDLQWNTTLPHLGALSNLEQVLRSHYVDAVVVALPIANPRTHEVLQTCEIQGVPVELALDALTSRMVNSRLVTATGVPRLVLTQIPHSDDALVWKRATDVVLSLLGLIVSAPLLAAIALAVKLDDGGPVFFSQYRSGQYGKPFRMYKFRSMRVDAEAVREQLMHLNEMSGPVFKISHDPRVTRVGRFLRKTSLDELPQLFNVLRGDMSLVGPRPPLPSEVNQYNPEHRRRLSVKPGITCLWQIGGRNEIDFSQWMQLDLQYIDSWTYWNDWRILLRTIPAVVKRRGAS
ncbi:MAG: sugar transferase [Alicyclobacillus sp.]|nr:sugar transferase [Alicyclobacillus sp.]